MKLTHNILQKYIKTRNFKLNKRLVKQTVNIQHAIISRTSYVPNVTLKDHILKLKLLYKKACNQVTQLPSIINETFYDRLAVGN